MFIGTDGNSMPAPVPLRGGSAVVASADSLLVQSNFSNLYVHEPDSTEDIVATVRGVEYARVSLTMPLAPPSSIQGVLRTVCRPN